MSKDLVGGSIEKVKKMCEDEKSDYIYKMSDGKYYVYQGYSSMKIIDSIFKTLSGSAGGSRRRRPSRKYKKSKRVLRRKSRSTRRR